MRGALSVKQLIINKATDGRHLYYRPIRDLFSKVYPTAINIMDPPQLFNFLFFAMFISLALSSIVGSWEPLVAAIVDDFPALRKHKAKVAFLYYF